MKQKPSIKGMCAYQNADGYCCNDEDKNAHSGEKCPGCEHYDPQTAITPEVLPPDNKAITQSGNNAILFSPDQVTGQYRRAIAGTLEMLRFGAMLAEIDHGLNRSTRKGCIQDGETLKAWLAENCPSINYDTAKQYKRLAEGVQREFRIPAKMRLTDALPEADGSVNGTIWSGVAEASREKVIEVRAEIWEFVNGKSARQLMFDLGLAERKPQGGSREGSGRPTKSAEEKLDLDGEIARKIILGNIDPLREEVLHRRGWMRISDDRLETMRTLLKEVVTKMSDELERRGRAKKFGR